MSPKLGKLKVCIVARKDLSRNTRIIRQARSLSQRGHEVTVVSLGLPMEESRRTTPGVRYVEVSSEPLSKGLTFLTRLLERSTWKRIFVLAPRRWARRIYLLVSWLPRVAVHRTLMFLDEVLPESLWQAGGAFAERRRRPVGGKVEASSETSGPHGQAAKPRTPERKKPRRGGFVAGLYLNLRDAAFAQDAGRFLAGAEFDVLQLHDAHALRVARRYRAGARPALIYDAVEIPEDRSGWAAQGVPPVIRWYEARLTSALVRQMDAVLTVSDGLRDWTARRYGVAAPHVIRNCRYYQDVTYSDEIRRDCRLAPDDRLVLYLNSLYGGQGLEQLVDSLAFLPSRIHMATLGPVAQPGFVEELRRRLDRQGLFERFHILEPKPPTQMLDYASGADIGVIPRQNTSLNNFHSLPNRVFELLMARLPIAGPSLQDMKHFIEGNALGLIFDETDPADIARTIQTMLEPETLRRLRERMEAAAREFSWDREGERYTTLMEQVARRVAERGRPHEAGMASHSPSSVPSP